MNGIRKHRGLRRYYLNLAKEDELGKVTWPNLDDTSNWTVNWHFHFDRWGYGIKSFKRRRPHLDKLFRHFDILVERTKRNRTDFQLYSVLLDFDSLSDALFLHSTSLNNSQFPFKISELQLTTTLTNRHLNDYLNKLDGYEKLYGKAGEAFCLIFKKDVGQPF